MQTVAINTTDITVRMWVMTFDRDDQEMLITINERIQVVVDAHDVKPMIAAFQGRAPIRLVGYPVRSRWGRVRRLSAEPMPVSLVFGAQMDRLAFASTFYASEGMYHWG